MNMGACFSCKRSNKKATRKTIRVVHLDGSLEDYEDPATAEQVINNFPNHFLCTPIQILQEGLVPLMLNHQLQKGQIYFMLPNSTLNFNASPMDLTSLTRKLTNIARSTSRCRTMSAPISPLASPLHALKPNSPNRFLDRRHIETQDECMLNSPKSPLWKPILDTITEG